MTRRPHPMTDQIRALLADGATNSAVRRQLPVSERVVARIRAEFGIPPVPRTAWQYAPHPQARTIRLLLDEGYANKEIVRRTGACAETVARMRRDGGFGRPTINPNGRRGKRPHPKEKQIRAMLRHHSSADIARLLKADAAAVRRIRAETGITYRPPRFTSPEEKWASLVREAGDGHLEWLGERAGRSRTPTMRFREQSVSPAAIAFTMRTGRPPVGIVRSECDYPGCVAPACVDDEPGRVAVRVQLRRIRGLPDPPGRCRHGHDQAEHGRYENDGTPYCAACKREQKRAARTAT